MSFYLLLLSVLVCLVSLIRHGNETLFGFGKEETSPIRCILALLIVLTHTRIGIFQGLGTVAVSIFFFLTGYGLIKSYQAKGKDYLKGYCKRRILPILIPYAIVCILWQTWVLCFESDDYYVRRIPELIHGDPGMIVPTSWFILAIFLIYGFFYISALYGKSIKAVSTVFVSEIIVYTILLIYLRIQYDFISSWFVSNSGIIVGVLVAYYEERIRQFVNDNRYKSIAICLAGLFLSYLISRHTAYYHLLLNAIAPLIVYLIVILSGTIRCKILIQGGVIALEIYLVQGAILKILWYFECPSSMAPVLAIVISIICAYLLYSAKNKIFLWLENLNSKNLK